MRRYLPVLLLLGPVTSTWVGCEGRPPSSTPPSPVSSSPSAPSRQGVRVPLPPGWEARRGADGDLRVGPSGEPAVLRIAARPSAGAAFPSLDALREQLPAPVRKSVRVEKDEQQARVLSFRVDGREHAVGLLGARRMGAELFLCAGTPALEAAQLEAAVEACAGISASGAASGGSGNDS